MSVSSALIGVVVGFALNVARDHCQSRKQRAEGGRTAAILITSSLRNYAEKCAEVVLDDGMLGGKPAGHTESGEPYYEPQVALPSAPQFPPDIDWKYLDAGLSLRALTLVNEAWDIKRAIQNGMREVYAPPYKDLINDRQERFARFGVKVLTLADDLGAAFKLDRYMMRVDSPDNDLKALFNHTLTRFERGRVISAVASEEWYAETREEGAFEQ